MEKETYAISRTMFCQSCYQRRKPSIGDLFVVYKHDHDVLAIKENHVAATHGFSPHLITWESGSEIVDGKIEVCICCCVNFCGIYIDPKEYNNASHQSKVSIQFVNTSYLWLPINEFGALNEKWRGNTGYNLF